MTRPSRRPRRIIIAGAALLAICCGIALWIGIDRRVGAGAVTRSDAPLTGAGGVQLDATLLVPRGVDGEQPAPAVLLAHGLGDSEAAMRSFARTLVRAGYVVRTWQSRGTGASEGRVGIASAAGEVADVRAIVDELAARPEVQRDAAGDPRVGILGVSHGGAVALLAGAADERIDAVVPIYAWWDLAEALEPGGVLKLRWASELFAAGSGEQRRADPCGNLEREVCDAWLASAAAGRLTPAARELLAVRSPASVAAKLRAPTLIVHGQMDSLFGLEQALALADALEAASVPVRVEWLRSGHDASLTPARREHVDDAVLRWFERHLRKRGGVEVGPRFTVELGSARGYAHAPRIPPETQRETLELAPDDADDAVAGTDTRIELAVPPAGLPADATTLPGLGDVTALNTGFEPPLGQRARYRSAPVTAGVELVGSPSVTLDVRADHAEALLFVRLVDIAPDGRRLVPRGLVTALRLEDLPPLDAREGQRVRVQLPHVAWRIAPGHRFGIEVSSTDAGYVAPAAPGVVSVEPASGADGLLTLPRVADPSRADTTFDSGTDWRMLIAAAIGLGLLATLTGIALSVRVRRRDARVQEPQLRDVPVSVRDLTKRYGRGAGRLVVDSASFAVPAGSVVGLMGPNGAGKTTILRMLLGLVHPDDGFVHVFGQRVRPGAPHLARIGALVEGPGLMEHLSGRAHLRRTWLASGRPLAQAGVEEVLAAVDLTADADRVVRTWSHGMRQRLGIAQALMGRPDVVLLDEPTNGLDPAQIIQLRELVRAVASDGRTVLLSSHLLGELEQVCSHVVLLAEGRVLRSGTLDEVRGAHADLEAAFLAEVGGTNA